MAEPQLDVHSLDPTCGTSVIQAPPLPVEIWEMIIDTCVYDDQYDMSLPYVQSATLLACALTCKTWRIRALICLYRTVLLNGDRRTRAMVEWLIQGTNLALRVYHLVNLIFMKDGRTPSPFYLVPYLLVGLPQRILNIQTLQIGSGEARNIDLGRSTHHTFLRSYASACFRSVRTLHLFKINFDSFSYFARLILCFPSLRALHDIAVSFGELSTHSPRVAMLKKLSLHSLDCEHRDFAHFSHLARWLVNAHATSSLASLNLSFDLASGVEDESADLEASLNRMLASAGSSLERLDLTDYGTTGLSVNLNPSTSLKEITLRRFSLSRAASTLSTVSSPGISILGLHGITLLRLSELNEIDAFIDILVSPRFSSMKSLRSIRIHLLKRSGFVWSGTQEEHKRAMEDAKRQVSRLRSTYGDRFYDGIDWGLLSKYKSNANEDKEQISGSSDADSSSYDDSGSSSGAWYEDDSDED